MKRRYGATLVAVIIGSWAACAFSADSAGQQMAEAAGQPLIGTLAPRLVLHTIDGQTIDLGKLYGKQAVYLKFWATWCVPCRQQMPHFEHTYETAGPDLAVIALNSGFNDSIVEVRDYRQKLGLTMPIVVDDGAAAAAFHLRVTPQHIVIGRDGRIVYVGHLADDRLEVALRDARTQPIRLAGRAESAASAVLPKRYGVGDNLTTASALTLDNKQFPFSDPAGRHRTVLAFISPWCESYLATSRPAMAASCRRFRERLGAIATDQKFRVVAIASGLWASTDDLRNYRKQHNLSIPLSLDATGDLFRTFGVNQVPAVVLVDEHGRIVRAVVPVTDPQEAF